MHPKINWPPLLQTLTNALNATVTQDHVNDDISQDELSRLVEAVPRLWAALRTDSGWKHAKCEVLLLKIIKNTKLPSAAQVSLLLKARTGGPLFVSAGAEAQLPVSLQHMQVGLRHLRTLEDCSFQSTSAPTVYKLLETVFMEEGL